MSLPSPCSPLSEFLLSPSLSNHAVFLNNTRKLSCHKFSGLKLVFIPAASLPTTKSYPPETTVLQSPILGKKEQRLYPKEGEELKGLPMKEEEQESLDFDEKDSKFQVSDLLDAVKALPCKERVDHIVRVLDKEIGVLSISDFNDALMALVTANESDLVLKLYSGLTCYSLEPNSWTFTIMVRCHCKKKDPSEAKRVLDQMMLKGFNPNVATLTTLINSFCKIGQLQNAFQVFEEGRPLKGFGVLKLMKQKKCMPDYISYSTLLHGLLLWGKVLAGLRIFKEMEGNGLEADDKLMNSLVRGLCRKSMKEIDLVEVAYQMFEKMKKRGFVIEHSTYALAIQALCVANKVDDAFINFLQMVRLGYIPRLIAINNVIRALCLGGKVDEAFYVLVLMYENSKIPSRMSYDLVIHELNRQERTLSACNVYGAALVRGVVPHKKPRR
ncbi:TETRATRICOPEPTIDE REPEAT (TPR)-LIKE SUPERFAMILY PROTEIN-RELATED [Salix purpurea]|uniref:TETRATRICOPEPTIDE REPEAT (TPR)-LIKE SUPERFAMILY PROTEIN-RELATED n=1 Tax=Salix purpurea TaxID=77065 RepID=A0A9Q0WEC6_SALPP|nr:TETRATRICOPEPTIDE REPEAT (TPR)-LIKE SUPERFAMILY PROTEIN-RELATED [Salix purpurea]